MESLREYKATRTKGNECAFAIPAFEQPRKLWNEPQYGLTKREYFAAMAMQGIVSTELADTYENFAKASVMMADALIEQLNKQK
jgi:hypothetical protein